MYNNKIKDISVVRYLKKIEILGIMDLELESDQIQYINSLKNLEKMYSVKGFKDMNILSQLNKNIKVIK